MTTWPSSSAGSSSPPDFAAHALSRPPRKKPEPSSPPGPPPGLDQQILRNTSPLEGSLVVESARDAAGRHHPVDERGRRSRSAVPHGTQTGAAQGATALGGRTPPWE